MRDGKVESDLVNPNPRSASAASQGPPETNGAESA
jgi:hypothetical protein